eukprot:SM000127S26627  [mRNA]  locus=s127:99700:102395:+ [translate_table: standard]
MHASPPEVLAPAPPLPPSSRIAAADDAPPGVQLSLCRRLLIAATYMHIATAMVSAVVFCCLGLLVASTLQLTPTGVPQPAQAPSLRGAINACRGPSPNATRCCRPLGVVQEELSILYPATYGQATVNIAVNAACNAALQAALQVRGVTVNVLALCPEELGVQCISPVRNTCPAKSVPERVLRPLAVACGSRAVNATIACSICLLELATGVNSLMHSSGSTHHVNQTVANDCAALLIVSALVVEPMTARSFAYIQRWNCRAVVPTDDEKTSAISIP